MVKLIEVYLGESDLYVVDKDECGTDFTGFNYLVVASVENLNGTTALYVHDMAFIPERIYSDEEGIFIGVRAEDAKSKAERLVNRISKKGEIDLQFWSLKAGFGFQSYEEEKAHALEWEANNPKIGW